MNNKEGSVLISINRLIDLQHNSFIHLMRSTIVFNVK